MRGVLQDAQDIKEHSAKESIGEHSFANVVNCVCQIPRT